MTKEMELLQKNIKEWRRSKTDMCKRHHEIGLLERVREGLLEIDVLDKILDIVIPEAIAEANE